MGVTSPVKNNMKRLITLATSSIAVIAVALLITAMQVEQPAEQTMPDDVIHTVLSLDDAQFIGAKKCRTCHRKEEAGAQFGKWEEGPHAGAYATLATDEAKEVAAAQGIDDPQTAGECLKCHTTGYGTAHGYPAVVKGKTWTEAETARAALTEGVQCEACHGPGSLYSVLKKKNKKYKRSEIVALGATAPPQAAHCAPCHVKECPTMPADYTFDFERDKRSEAVHKHKKLKYDHDG